MVVSLKMSKCCHQKPEPKRKLLVQCLLRQFLVVQDKTFDLQPIAETSGSIGVKQNPMVGDRDLKGHR